MQILSVTLKNFKTHADRHFVFQPGTNAICGENGAGKTSILEAIAWTLFNYKGSYRLEDLIRNGNGSAQATVSFVSNRDGRTYEVQRCTSKGYTLYDPQLSEQLGYRHIEEEVLPWLRQHLGVAPGTDLARLFANTIGVPQGTFTADFLKSPEDRKKVFDSILKVEEYKQANQELLSLEKYAKAEEENLQRAIAQYNETLEERDPLHQRHLFLSKEITQDETNLQTLQAELTALQSEKDRLALHAQQVQQLETQLHTLGSQIEGKQQAIALIEQSLERARQAVLQCEQSRASHQHYLQAEAALKGLEQRAKQRQALQKQWEAKQKALGDRQTDLTRLTVQLEGLKQSAELLEKLRPQIQQQIELEQQQEAIAQQLQQIQALKVEVQSLMQQHTRLKGNRERLMQEIDRLRSLELIINKIPELEQQRDRFQEQLSRIEAAQQFEADLRQLLSDGQEQRDRYQEQAQTALDTLQKMQEAVPLLAIAPIESVLSTIQSGVDLNDSLLGALHQILEDLSEQTSAPRLQKSLKQVKTQIDLTYQQRAEFLTLEAKGEQLDDLQGEAEQLRKRLTQLQQNLTVEPALQEQRSLLAAALSELGDPRSRSQMLERDLKQRTQLETAYRQIQQTQADAQQEVALLKSQLQQYDDLETQIEQQQQHRQIYQEGYLTFVQNQKTAEQLLDLEAGWQGAIAQLEQITTQQRRLKDQFEQLSLNYDPQRWHQVEATYAEIRSQADQTAGGLPQKRKLLAELEGRLSSLQALAEKRDRTRLDLKQREKVRRFVAFARKAYKEAGPRITERYVQSISREADRLFRELINRPNVALEWTRDYEITVQEGAHSRRFINLSGGEQMCAALAVRLALLRVLADIDVAFFDEPTTNMDRPRRESLAEAIANIRSFQQVFVISHDDTFEKVTENVILVERE